MDAPKSLADSYLREGRKAALLQPHAAPLAEFVSRLRLVKGSGYAIPDFDPWDGGINAECLLLLEAPGAKAVASGFVSRNNPDETAKNKFLLSEEAGIDRRRTLLWNIVPWYVGTETRIRPVTRTDLSESIAWLDELLDLLPKVRIVAFVGQKAATAGGRVAGRHPNMEVLQMPHPSSLFVNRRPGNRDLIRERFKELANLMSSEISVERGLARISDVAAPDMPMLEPARK